MTLPELYLVTTISQKHTPLFPSTSLRFSSTKSFETIHQINRHSFVFYSFKQSTPFFSFTIIIKSIFSFQLFHNIFKQNIFSLQSTLFSLSNIFKSLLTQQSIQFDCTLKKDVSLDHRTVD